MNNKRSSIYQNKAVPNKIEPLSALSSYGDGERRQGQQKPGGVMRQGEAERHPQKEGQA